MKPPTTAERAARYDAALEALLSELDGLIHRRAGIQSRLAEIGEATTKKLRAERGALEEQNQECFLAEGALLLALRALLIGSNGSRAEWESILEARGLEPWQADEMVKGIGSFKRNPPDRAEMEAFRAQRRAALRQSRAVDDMRKQGPAQ